LYRIVRLRALPAALTLTLALFQGCHTPRDKSSLAAKDARSSATPFHFSVKPGANLAETMEIRLDGRVVFSTSAGATTFLHRFDVFMTPGWHRVQTSTSTGASHTAVVQSDREKWIRVAREPAKPEGIGVHVTEFPLR
jgi:hypothetical protein